MAELATPVLLSVITSSGMAAILTALLSGRNERRRVLREQRIKVAGDYASDAMEAMARLRDYQPTFGSLQRNAALHSNSSLRSERAYAVDLAIDKLRPQRGRVFVTFPGRSSKEAAEKHGPVTTADWAERTIGALRSMKQTSDAFWEACDAEPHSRSRYEKEFDAKYQEYHREAWTAIDRFAETASEQFS